MRQARRSCPLTVCVIEQNVIAAEYLFQLLARAPDIRPLRVEDCLESGAPLSRPVFLIDNWELSIPVTQWTMQLERRYPESHLLLLDREKSSSEIVQMLSLGIQGYIEHHEVSRTLPDAVRAIASGRIWASSEVLQMYVRLTAPSTRRQATEETATPREAQIIELVRRRLSNKEIAAILNVQESTVKFHLSNIFSKFRVTGRHALHKKDEIPSEWTKLLA